jgi:hypothetical protein
VAKACDIIVNIRLFRVSFIDMGRGDKGGVVVNLLAWFKEPEPEINNAKAPNSQSIMHPRKV